MEFFTARADESRRTLLLREEGERSGQTEEMEQELLGKRVWRVGGVGILQYALDPAQEKQKRSFWKSWSSSRSNGKEDWLVAARARTAFYNDGKCIQDETCQEYRMLMWPRFSSDATASAVEDCREERQYST